MDMFGEDNDNENENENESSSSRPLACGVLSFHNGTEESMFIYITNHCARGDIKNILNSIDKFCYSRHWMMHIGERKREFLINAIKSAQQAARVNSSSSSECFSCLEIGSYCGYSALVMANELSDTGHLFCIERDPKCCRWTKQLLDYALLSNKVTIFENDVSDESLSHLIKKMEEDYHCSTLNLVFIDHDKAFYLSDLQQIVSKRLLHSGSVVVADNVLSFGRPLTEYLQYVQDPHGLFSSSATHQDHVEYSSIEDSVSELSPDDLIDAVEVSIFR